MRAYCLALSTLLLGCDQDCFIESERIALDESVQGVTGQELLSEVSMGHQGELGWLDQPRLVHGDDVWDVSTALAGTTTTLTMTMDHDGAWAVRSVGQDDCAEPSLSVALPMTIETDDGVLGDALVATLRPQAPITTFFATPGFGVPLDLGLSVEPDHGVSKRLHLDLEHHELSVVLANDDERALIVIGEW